MRSLWFPESRYSPLSESYEDSVNTRELIKRESTFRLRTHTLFAIIVVASLLAGLAGYGSGTIVAIHRSNSAQGQGMAPQGEAPFVCSVRVTDKSKVPIGHNINIFKFNESFADVPLRNTPEPIWDTLIPNGLGYVTDTPLSGPNLTVIGVFHQLHCLYTLRRAYFSNTTGGEDFDFGLDRSNHTAHCFEYLRQSIICSADSTLEPAENRQTGFLGWGFKRSCSNFEELKDWAEKWKAFELHGFLANPRHQHL